MQVKFIAKFKVKFKITNSTMSSKDQYITITSLSAYHGMIIIEQDSSKSLINDSNLFRCSVIPPELLSEVRDWIK